MSVFRIEFDPPVPPAPRPFAPLSWDKLQYQKIAEAFPQEYDIAYWIDDRQFRYYPASIVTAINDIQLELDLIRERNNHYMTLSGYTVLELRFSDGRARFYDPVGVGKDRKDKPIGTDFDATAIERAFKSAIDSLLFLVGYEDSSTTTPRPPDLG
jgi:hypothetical protein